MKIYLPPKRYLSSRKYLTALFLGLFATYGIAQQEIISDVTPERSHLAEIDKTRQNEMQSNQTTPLTSTTVMGSGYTGKSRAEVKAEVQIAKKNGTLIKPGEAAFGTDIDLNGNGLR